MTTRDKIIEHFTNNPGKLVAWKTIGTTWEEGAPVVEALITEGVLEWRKVESATGRKISKLFVAGF